MSVKLAAHQHGKGRVRLGRVWREGKTHYMVEWTVFCMLESDMAHAFIEGSNADMTATDTQKNTVRICSKCCGGPGRRPCLTVADACARRYTLLPNNARSDVLQKSMPSLLLSTMSRPIQR